MIVPASELLPLVEEAIGAGGRSVRITVGGGSMSPFLRDGDTVEIGALVKWPPAVGDILLAKRGKRDYLLHRVSCVRGDVVHLLGDAQRCSEGPFARRQIVGRVNAAWRGSRRLPLDHPAWQAAARLWLVLTPCRHRIAPVGRMALAVCRMFKGPKAAGSGAAGAVSPLATSDYSHLLYLLRSGPGALAAMPPEQRPDWPVLMRAAAEQEVLPLVCERVSHLPIELRPPPEVARRLNAIRTQALARAAFMCEQLRGILAALRDAQVPAIPLKGAHLAALVYQSPAERQFGDLDVLVRRDSLSLVRTVLGRIGWQPKLSSAEARSHHDSYVLPGAHVELEVHWTLPLRQGFLPDSVVDSMWSRARAAEVAWTQTPVLAPEDLLLSLILHIYCSHGFAVSLRRIYDLVALSSKYGGDLDWAYASEQARALGLTRAVAVLRSLLSEWFELELPVDTSREELSACFGEAVELAKRSILCSHGAKRADRTAAQVVRSPSRRAYVADVWRKLFLPRRQMEVLYKRRPGSLAVYPLYAVRAVHLSGRYLPIALRACCNRRCADEARAWDWLGGLS